MQAQKNPNNSDKEDRKPRGSFEKRLSELHVILAVIVIFLHILSIIQKPERKELYIVTGFLTLYFGVWLILRLVYNFKKKNREIRNLKQTVEALKKALVDELKFSETDYYRLIRILQQTPPAWVNFIRYSYPRATPEKSNELWKSLTMVLIEEHIKILQQLRQINSDGNPE